MAVSEKDVIIVGGGIAGLTCARLLHHSKINIALYEASDRIGGRLKTDRKDGFLLDRGFQVLQTAYPSASEELDYKALRLHTFAPGSMVRIDTRFHTVADPLRRPADVLNTMTAPIGTIGDRLRLVRLAKEVVSGSLEDLFKEPEHETLAYLRQRGFSEKMINRFFIPFFGGVCLDHSIQASSRVFRYILRMFAAGDAALPEDGMEQIPLQLAERIPQELIRTGSRVAAVQPGTVRLQDGSEVTARAIILAAEEPETCRLLDRAAAKKRSVGETCLYFACDRAPWHTSYLVLNGNSEGPINNLAMPSMVSPAYAPDGKSLVSVVVLEEQSLAYGNLLEAVRSQLRQWYGREVDDWRHLASYDIAHALPEQSPPSSDPHAAKPMVGEGIFVCGEYGSLPAIQWALFSAKKAAEAVSEYLQSGRS